ncbi:MAG: hypothetical protein HYY06_02155 [Deltaproteobacteria bacterium]|nr:hypothetical protein [Deltaproteobacteria bacterium]
MRNKEFYLPGVIIAGLVGVVSALAGACCCLCGALTVFSGLLAVHLVRRKSGGLPIEIGEGAVIGLLSGLVTALLSIIVNLVARLAMEGYVTQLQAQMGGDQMRSLELGSGVLGIVISSLVGIVIHGGFGALGGTLAVPLLKTSAAASGTAPPTM